MATEKNLTDFMDNSIALNQRSNFLSELCLNAPLAGKLQREGTVNERPVMHIHRILGTRYYLFSQECVTFLGIINGGKVAIWQPPPHSPFPHLFQFELI